MKKPYILAILFFLSTLLFLVLFLDAKGTITYECASYKQNTLNLEATDFCLRMALAYCTDDTYTLQLHALPESLPVPDAFHGSAAITGLKQTQYVADPTAPYAVYAIDYILPASDPAVMEAQALRQTMQATKDLDSGKWAFTVLAYE